MLDAFAIIGAQIFFDLPATGFPLFVQGDANFPVWRGHRFRSQPGIFALDVEKADFAEVENPLVPVRPMRHPTAVNIVSKVIDFLETRTDRIAVDPRQIFEVDVVDRQRVWIIQRRITVDKVDESTADALDRRDSQLHHAGLALDGLGPAFQRLGIGFGGVFHAEGHAAGGRAVLGCEKSSWASRFVVGDQVDLTLTPQMHVLRPVRGDMGEAHRCEYGFEQAFFGGGKFDEFESV